MKLGTKVVANYLTVIDGEKKQLYSLKEFLSKFDSYAKFDEDYSKTIYFTDDIYVEGFDYLKLVVGSAWICFESWENVLLAGSQAQVLRKDGVGDGKIVELLEVLYP